MMKDIAVNCIEDPVEWTMQILGAVLNKGKYKAKI